MPRYVDNEIASYIQLVDSQGAPINGATVNYVVRYDRGVEITGTMSFEADGLYYAWWTPDNRGEWIFEAYCETYHFRNSQTYYVEEQPSADKVWSLSPGYGQQFSGIVQGQWVTFVDLSGGIKAYQCTVYQLNDENVAKDLEVRITVDSSYTNLPCNTTASVAHAEIRNIYLDSLIFQFYFKDINAFPWSVFLGPTNWRESPALVNTIPLECETLKIEFRLTSAPGTNQRISGQIGYATRRTISNNPPV